MITITEKSDGSRHWVDVTNADGAHLFSHLTVEKAEATLSEDHKVLAAQVFRDPANAPDQTVRIVRLAEPMALAA